LNHKVYTTQKANNQRQEHCSTLKQQQNNRHTKGRSHKLATQVHRKALSEIYDVLLVTAQLARDRLKAAETTVATEVVPAITPEDGTDLSAAENGSGASQQSGAAGERESTAAGTSGSTQQGQTDEVSAASVTGGEGTDMLETSLAQAHFLQPKQLSDAIAVILAALSPRSVSRAQFIEFTLHCMHKTHDLQQQQQSEEPQRESLHGSVAASPAATGASNASPAVGVRAEFSTPSSALATDTRDPPDAQQATDAAPPISTPISQTAGPVPATTPATTHKPLLAPSPGTSSTPLARFTPPTTPRSASRGRSAAGTPNGVVIPPIGYLLVAARTGGSGTSTQQERQKGTQAQREYDAHFTGKPELAAQKTTERLAKQRYRDRSAGKQRVEDSFIACTVITSYPVVL
jgi:hypothetical protein